jgi:hypothetical protein
MYKFQTIRAVTSFENGRLKPIKLSTLINSKIVKIKFAGNEGRLYFLNILTQKDLSNLDRKNSVLEIVKDGEEIADSIYLNSFSYDNIEYHICLLKE